VKCVWVHNRSSRQGGHISLDLILELWEQHAAGDGHRHHSPADYEFLEEDSPLLSFIQNCISATRTPPIIIKCILPKTTGYITRSDFLACRLQGCEMIEAVRGFSDPCARVFSEPDGRSFSALALCVIGCIQIRNSTDNTSPERQLAALEDILEDRLSYPWLSEEPIRKTRLAWIRAREHIDVCKPMFEPALAMGIDIVVIDYPGHWLQDDNGPGVYLREAFIPLDISPDEGFVDRLVAAIQKHSEQSPIDGLITVSDFHLTRVAKACEVLNLPTSASTSYELAVDKFATRMMELDTHGSFRVFGVDDLHQYLDAKPPNSAPFPYPLVVKPCAGWGSEQVTKVQNSSELFFAVSKASAANKNAPKLTLPRSDVIIEPYIDGPEVDANFVLLDKALLFYEISDDFPSPADRFTDLRDRQNFCETVQLIPSALPKHELDVLRDSVYESILRQGFVTGVFHCEARVKDSCMEYSVQDGILDLRPRTESFGAAGRPTTYLHEINARAPAYSSTMTLHHTYGVDYYALQLALSIGDKARFRAFAIPYRHAPQCTTAAQYLHDSHPGVMVTEDAGAELLELLPRLRSYIPMYRTIKRKGDEVMKNPSYPFMAFFVIQSKLSREECLKIMRVVEENFRVVVDSKDNRLKLAS
jgi:biotin carboxylase